MVCESILHGDTLVDPEQVTSALCALDFLFLDKVILHNTCHSFLRAELRTFAQLEWKNSLFRLEKISLWMFIKLG